MNQKNIQWRTKRLLKSLIEFSENFLQSLYFEIKYPEDLAIVHIISIKISVNASSKEVAVEVISSQAEFLISFYIILSMMTVKLQQNLHYNQGTFYHNRELLCSVVKVIMIQSQMEQNAIKTLLFPESIATLKKFIITNASLSISYNME